MGRLDFGQPPAPPIAQHLHDDTDVVDGDAVEGLQHGLPTDPDPEPTDLVGFRWRVPLSWVHNQPSWCASLISRLVRYIES